MVLNREQIEAEVRRQTEMRDAQEKQDKQRAEKEAQDAKDG